MKRPDEIKIAFDDALQSARQSASEIEARKAKQNEPFDFLNEILKAGKKECK